MAQAEKDLSAEELDVLRDLARPGLLKKAIPERVLKRLVALGYAEEKLGGPVATPKGKIYLLPPQRK